MGIFNCSSISRAARCSASLFVRPFPVPRTPGIMAIAVKIASVSSRIDVYSGKECFDLVLYAHELIFIVSVLLNIVPIYKCFEHP